MPRPDILGHVLHTALQELDYAIRNPQAQQSEAVRETLATMRRTARLREKPSPENWGYTDFPWGAI